MRRYVFKRLLISVVLLFFVSLIIYIIMRSIPTSYVETQARMLSQLPGAKSYTEWLAQLNETYGMDKGIVPGYFQWLKSAIRGDFGDSWQFNVPVTQKFAQVIWYSFVLGAIAFVLQIGLAVPLGILAARRQYSRMDYGITVVALLGISLPTFFFATVLKLIFAVWLDWFPLYGTVGRFYMQLDSFGRFLDLATHYFLPVLTLTIIGIGSLMRYTRTNMLEVLNADFIRTARAKGLSEKRVINYHAFRNTLIPLVTILGGSLPGLFAGALITETLFQIEGIGYTAYRAMVSGDIPFTMFYMVFMAVLTILGTLIADILYAVVDPRVRIG
ncbi:MAG: ABC transporter permease [Dethiosulfatibacter sp.]|nr:ABC transporter permease [Dethiosulfatibacter sp.]